MTSLTFGPAGLSCRAISIALVLCLSWIGRSARATELPGLRTYFLDCSSSNQGNGSEAHPWNTLHGAEAHQFLPNENLALRRGSVCHGSFSPRGSGTKDAPIRLTAYGEGSRPRIVASSSDRQVLLLSDQEYFQIDSLDLSGADTYGIYVTAYKGRMHHIYLKNLSIHDIYGGAMKNKDNGLVVVGPAKLGAVFEDVLIDGVDAAHTNQWAGILVGGGPFYIPPEAYINDRVTIRNSSVHDVYGDGIVLFRDSNSLIETSVAWLTGMQPTQTIGTPNAIWTWTCTDCTVQDNEAFLTDSPGVDGGAYDIDWSNTRNIVQRNFAHDTQGYCFAVFAAGYVTSDSIVRENLCMDNGLSPRLAAMQGAAYVTTWNGGRIRNLHIENNTIIWKASVSSASAVVDSADMDGDPVAFTGNRIESVSPIFYRTNSQFAPSGNAYLYRGSKEARFTLGNHKKVSLEALQASGLETGSTLITEVLHQPVSRALRLEATIGFVLDSDGLLAPASRAQLVVLRSLTSQYGSDILAVTVHFRRATNRADQERTAFANAITDLDAPFIKFDNNGEATDSIRLLTDDGHLIEQWQSFLNAATLGRAVRERLGIPSYSRMSSTDSAEETR